MRKNTKKIDIIIIAVLILLIIGGILLAVLPKNDNSNEIASAADTDQDGELTYNDYKGRRIGIKTGSSFEPITFEYLPDSEYVYFDSTSDLAVALENDKIDAFLEDEPVLRIIKAENSNLDYIEKPLVNDDYSFMFPKNSKKHDDLRLLFNEMLTELKDSGRLEEMTDKWFGSDESAKTFDRTPSSGENGELLVGGPPDNVPFAYYSNNEYTGYAVELITIFGQKYGYSIKFEQPNIAALIAGVTSGMYDIAIGSISVTEERKESANFSDTVYNGGVVLAVRASDLIGYEDVEDRPFSYYAENKKIGALTGGLYEIMIRERYPEAEILQYNNQPDMAVVLSSGAIDAFTCPESSAKEFLKADPTLTYLNEVFMKIPYGFAFEKSSDKEYLRDQMNAFLNKLHSDGTYDGLVAKWFGDDDSVKTVDLSGLTGNNGTIRYITAPTIQPFSYIVNGQNAGFEVEIISRFCREYGYALSIDNAEFASLIPGITSGMYDIASGTIMITDERAESVNFSDVYYTAKAVAVVRKETGSEPSVNEFNGKRAGVLTGSMHDEVISRNLHDCVICNYNNYSDLIAALKSNQIDFFIGGFDSATQFCESNPELTFLKSPLESMPIGAMFAKNEKGAALRDKFNEFLDKLYADGTRDEIYRYWLGEESKGKFIDYSDLTGENGTLVLATSGTESPVSYISNGHIAGTDPDIAVRFCREYGYGIDIQLLDNGGMIPGLVQGMYDFVLDDKVITEERKESVYFSDPYNYADIHIIARKSDVVSGNTGSDTVSDTSIIDSIVLSFEKNFIREDRWKLILEGVGTTCLITALSAIFGSVLAFLICMFRRTGSKLANAISNIYVKLLQGTPIVVLLMILYYVLLGKSGLEAVWVAVIGFTLNFGAYASEIMRSGIESINGGQREAALALGHNDNQAFFRFIFPQAVVRFLPVYRGEIVSLLKSTSIVGYIAIQDLTKMSDIIRSRTYEAFFPLIATAIIYFILAWIIILILKLVMNLFDRRHNRRHAKKVFYGTAGKPCAEQPVKEVNGSGSVMIKVDHLCKQYPNVTPLEDVCVEINRGDVISVIGPSGTGKSTLLRCLNQLEEPTSGTVTVDGEVITDPKCDISLVRRKMGMVFQSFNLFDNLNIIENVIYSPVNLLKMPREQAFKEGMELLKRVGLAEKAENYPDELSGGQKQRVAIARAIAMKPEIILFDEPTSALDPTMVGEVLAVIRSLAKEGMTMMIVTHEMKFARDVSNRVFYMDEGGICEDGTPQQIFEAPLKEKTRIFIKRLKQLSLEITSLDFDFIGFITQIEQFGRDNLLSPAVIRNLQLAFEELVAQNITGFISRGGKGLPIKIEVEHSETDETETMTIIYGGEKYDPFTDGDELSAMIVKKLAKETVHEYDGMNRLTVKFA